MRSLFLLILFIAQNSWANYSYDTLYEYECEQEDAKGTTPREYSIKQYSQTRSFKIIDVYKPTWMESMFGTSKTIPFLQAGRHQYNPNEMEVKTLAFDGFDQIPTREYLEVSESAFGYRRTDYYESCVVEGCEQAYYAFKVSGFDYGMDGYSHTVIYNCFRK